MEKKVFCSCFYIIMSSPTPSNILQNNAEILEKQWHEIQQRHRKEKQLLLQLEEVAKLCQAEHIAQKARRKAEKKAREKAKRQKIEEKKLKKKRILEYLQQLQDEILEEKAILLERAEGSQVMGSKHKEITAGDEEG